MIFWMQGGFYVFSSYKTYPYYLFNAGELLGPQIASIHNLSFYLWLVGEARKHILAGDFLSWKDEMVKQLDTKL